MALNFDIPAKNIIHSSSEKAFMKRAGHVDLFTAGFPCQPFSIQGAGLGKHDSRGSVIKDICSYLERAKPKAFILENVGGLVRQEVLQVDSQSLERHQG